MNLATIIDSVPDADPALISRGRVTDYGTLRRQVGGMRGGLVELGVEPGDRVAILCANNWYFVVSYLAVLGVGAVAVPLNPLSPPLELEKQLDGVGASCLIVGPSGHGTAAQLDREELPDLRMVITSEDGAPSPRLQELIASEPTEVVDRADDDLAVLIYTSGTGGAPKAAMLSHGNLLANIDQVGASRGIEAGEPGPRGEVTLGVLPLFHIFGLNVILGTALRSGTAILLIERFDPVSAAEAIVRHRVSVVAGVPTMWSDWVALPDLAADTFAGVRLASSGAAELHPEVAKAVRSRFGIELAQGYGLTEASPAVTSETGLVPRPGSIGAPLPGVEVRLIDADGEDTLVGDPGEIWVRGPNVFQGYWNDVDATAAAVDADGWLHTGDIAVVDDDGYLYLSGRSKELVIVSGFNVYPAEVEQVINEMPGVAMSAVVGVKHPHTGEAVKAFVVLDDGHATEEDAVIEHCARHLARYKCPRKVNFVDELPTNLSGKVVRRALT